MRSTSRGAILPSSDPSAYLPHRYPFLLIDRVTSLVPGEHATGVKLVTGGAMPSSPFLLVEAIAQMAGIAAGQREGEGGMLAAVNRCVFHSAVAPGDTLLVSARIVASFGGLFMAEGEIRSGSTRVVTTTVTLRIGKG